MQYKLWALHSTVNPRKWRIRTWRFPQMAFFLERFFLKRGYGLSQVIQFGLGEPTFLFGWCSYFTWGDPKEE